MITPNEQQQITTIREVLDGMEQGMKWQIHRYSGTGWDTAQDQTLKNLLYWLCETDIRLEPLPPTPRDWNGPEDCPVGCYMRYCTTESGWQFVHSCDKNGIGLFLGPYDGLKMCLVTWETIAANWLYSTDLKTWKRCTVEVRA